MEKETGPDVVKLQEYVVALEASRRDLWGVNEELREKIAALERGQEELQRKLELFRGIVGSAKAFRTAWLNPDDINPIRHKLFAAIDELRELQ